MRNKLTLFIDSQCPLCVAEIKHLRKLDKQQNLAFIDIHSAGFSKLYPEINPLKANQILHGKLASGQIITGIDVTYQAWILVGKGYLVAPLKWKLLRPVFKYLYLKFAKHRYKISYLLTGKSRCASGACDYTPTATKSKINLEAGAKDG